MSKEKVTSDSDGVPETPVVPTSAQNVRRIALRVAYDGGAYVGWQRQGPSINGKTVQETIERALADLLREPVTLHTAGRTDTGVHARGQCAHFDVPPDDEHAESGEKRPGVSMPIEAFVPALMRRLPRDISVWQAVDVSPEFHARFRATRRSYRYVLTWADKNAPVPCLARRNAGHIRGPHDVEAMRAAAAAIEGEHDFSRLRSSLCQADNPVRSIDVARLEPLGTGDDEAGARLGLFPGCGAAEFTISARAFLMHQVRLLVGGISLVGRGRITLDEWRAVLEGAEPSTNLAPAPPSGLTLDWVDYPAEFGV